MRRRISTAGFPAGVRMTFTSSGPLPIFSGGRIIQQRSRVSAERFERTHLGDAIPVIYLPDDPELFALGPRVKPNCFHLLMGLLFLAIGGIHHLFGRSSARSWGLGAVGARGN